MPILIGLVLGVLWGFHDLCVLKRNSPDPVLYEKWNHLWKATKLTIILGTFALLLLKIEPLHIVTMWCFWYVSFEPSLNKMRGLNWFYITKDKTSARWDNLRRLIYGTYVQEFEMVLKILIALTGVTFYLI